MEIQLDSGHDLKDSFGVVKNYNNCCLGPPPHHREGGGNAIYIVYPSRNGLFCSERELKLTASFTRKSTFLILTY